MLVPIILESTELLGTLHTQGMQTQMRQAVDGLMHTCVAKCRPKFCNMMQAHV